MGKRVIISESQYNSLVSINILNESFFEASTIDEFKKELRKIILKLALAGIAISSIPTIINHYCEENNKPSVVTQEYVEEVLNNQNNPVNEWKLGSNNVTATVYNAVTSQCNGDFGHTASMFNLNLDDVFSHKIIAMERTFMKKLGLKYGDVVKIEGAGNYDGIYQVQDVMNKRFAGQEKIDILVPENIKHGEWDNVKLYTLTDKTKTEDYKTDMAPEVSEKECQMMMNKRRQEKNK